jgi:FdhE protein
VKGDFIRAAGADNNILSKLEESGRKKGVPPRFLEFYRRLLGIQSDARLRVGIARLGLSREAVTNRLTCGVPLLRFEDLSLDWSRLWDVFEQVTTLCTDYPEVLGKVPENPRDLDSCLAYLKEATEAWFEEGQLPPQISLGGLKGAILEFIIQAALRPFLLNHCQALLGLVNQELWRRGYCPICGGSPDFAFMDKESGARWLLCSRCDAQWLFQRLECPYCSTREPETLSYFTDDEGLYRLYVCEQCRHYLKAIDLRRAKYEVLLPLERFLTLDLDIQAHKDGYTPGVKARQGEEMRGQCGATLLTKEES